MAERRMFAKCIILSDAFLDMPMSARCLYFTLGMLADDDGFVNAPKSIMRQCGASEDDLKLLIAKSYVLVFENGVIVLKHWKIHNYIQTDRYKPTSYIAEKQMLTLTDNKEYTLNSECIQNVSIMDTQVRLGKDRDRDKDIKKSSHFVPPSLEEVKAYCDERKNGINAESFIDFYSSKNWMIGKNKMSDWKACVRTWEKRKKESPELTARDIKMGHTTPEDQKTRISDDDMRKLIMRGRMKRES